MRWMLLAGLLLMAGCLEETQPPAQDEARPMDVYRFAYPGSDVAVAGAPHGWLFQISNPASTAMEYSVRIEGVQHADMGPAGQEAVHWMQGNGPLNWTLPGNASTAFLVQPDLERDMGEGDIAARFIVNGHVAAAWNITRAQGSTVQPGQHVQTYTVGVWENGTSFYTNIAALNEDRSFPAGYPRIDFGGDPLPIYVYDEDRSEQPGSSRDTCHFTTIDGYNSLLKTQAEGSTGVRYLQPEEAYTRDGAEDHFLYGDALIFLNTVSAIDGEADQAVAEPTGDCFDPTNRIPGVPPVS